MQWSFHEFIDWGKTIITWHSLIMRTVQIVLFWWASISKFLNICKENIWLSFLYVLALSLLWYLSQLIYLMLLVGFRSVKKCLIKKSVKKSGSNNIAYYRYGHVFLKRETFFHRITIFCHYWYYWCLWKINLKVT